MSGISERRKRVLRIRVIEHRAASLKVVEADSVLSNLHSVAGRITALRTQLAVGEGHANGQALKAMCEMAQRLDTARGGLKQPIGEAQAMLTHMQKQRVLASQKEESAAKLKGRAAASEARASELRADANRPFRKLRTAGEHS
jgi:hypothetical protein